MLRYLSHSPSVCDSLNDILPKMGASCAITEFVLAYFDFGAFFSTSADRTNFIFHKKKAKKSNEIPALVPKALPKKMICVDFIMPHNSLVSIIIINRKETHARAHTTHK